MKEIELYTDGACSGNPGPGGYGAVLKYGTTERELSGGDKETTTNRMELMAAIVGLEALKEPCAVTLTSDSKYLVDAISSMRLLVVSLSPPESSFSVVPYFSTAP